MAVRDEVEDGMGFAGMVASKGERERERFVEALRKIAAMDYTRAATNGMGFDAVNIAREAIGLQRMK